MRKVAGPISNRALLAAREKAEPSEPRPSRRQMPGPDPQNLT
jgi:hypothetical protein